MKRLIFGLLLLISNIVTSSEVVYQRLNVEMMGENILSGRTPNGYQEGFVRQDDGVYFCDGGTGGRPLGVAFGITLNQKQPLPILAGADSKCEDVDSSSGSNYSLYLDIQYTDGTFQWGQQAPFSVGQAGNQWSRKTVLFMPEKPIKSLTMYMLFRGTPGKAWFRNPSFQVSEDITGDAFRFDAVSVRRVSDSLNKKTQCIKYYVRDITSDGDFCSLQMNRSGGYSGNGLAIEKHPRNPQFISEKPLISEKPIISETPLISKTPLVVGDPTDRITVRNTTGGDRAVTLYQVIPLSAEVTEWLGGIDMPCVLDGRTEFVVANTIRAGAGRLSSWPLMGVRLATGETFWLGIAPDLPAVYRLFYNSRTNELCIAFDLGFTEKKTQWTLGTVHFNLTAEQSKWGYRSGWRKYMNLYPRAFECRLPRDVHGEQRLGNWMPFAPISQVEGWEDFGFRFKEGTGETVWDDEHDIITYRYTEPMTWWMSMSKDLPKTMDTALAEVKRQAEASKSPMTMARSWQSSVMHDVNGQPVGLFQDTPWCVGVVWSMNSMPGIRPIIDETTQNESVGDKTTGQVTSPAQFDVMWDKTYVQNNYGTPAAPVGDANFNKGIDGEYIDSSEGYVTTELDFRTDHFDAVSRPLTFDAETKKIAIYRGLVTFEYVESLSKTVRSSGRTMMANSTPYQLTWLMPLLDVIGTETNWNWSGSWHPIAQPDLIRKRAFCGPKPYCFLQNTDFSKFGYRQSELFMKRSLAFGMFPGYFSHNASDGQYFTRPELYNRDRPLFKTFLPLCRMVGEAGWEPETLVQVVNIDQVENLDNDSTKGVNRVNKADGITAERFGGGPSGDSVNIDNAGCYITLFNFDSQTRTAMVRIPEHLKLADVCYGAAISSEQLKATDTPNVWQLTLESEDVAVWKIIGR